MISPDGLLRNQFSDLMILSETVGNAGSFTRALRDRWSLNSGESCDLP